MGFFVRIGQIAYRFATKKAAQAFAKGRKGASVVAKKPEGVTVKPGPRPQSNVNQPRSADTGKMQSPKPSPATRRDTSPSSASPKKPTAPARTDKAPKAVGRPTRSKTEMATREPAQPKSGRPNLRSKAGAAAGLRGATMPSADKAPTADKTTPTRPNNKSGEMPSVRKTKVTPTNKSGEMPKTKKAETKKSTSKTTRPKMNPLDGWSDARRKALRSDKIGTDAGDGMKWVVGSNHNALVRTRDTDRVKENLRLQKLVKQTKDTYKKPDNTSR